MRNLWGSFDLLVVLSLLSRIKNRVLVFSRTTPNTVQVNGAVHVICRADLLVPQRLFCYIMYHHLVWLPLCGTLPLRSRTVGFETATVLQNASTRPSAMPTSSTLLLHSPAAFDPGMKNSAVQSANIHFFSESKNRLPWMRGWLHHTACASQPLQTWRDQRLLRRPVLSRDSRRPQACGGTAYAERARHGGLPVAEEGKLAAQTRNLKLLNRCLPRPSTSLNENRLCVLLRDRGVGCLLISTTKHTSEAEYIKS